MRLTYETNWDIDELHRRLVPVLESIDGVCRQHGLRYYLWAGTMLGSIRHKGFIPWDDDMDIAMPRPDYEQLMAHCGEWMPAPFEIIGSHNRADYPFPFAKVIDGSTTVIERPDFPYPEGIYIDIFPIDGAPSDEKEAHRHLHRYHTWRHLLFLRGRNPFKHGHGPRSWWPLLLHKLFTLKWLQDKVQGLMKKYKYEESSYIIDYDFGMKGIMEKSIVGEPKPCEFEGKMFQGVENPDRFLTHLYGDYMKLPPLEKQVQHKFYYINFNQSYHDYKP